MLSLFRSSKQLALTNGTAEDGLDEAYLDSIDIDFPVEDPENPNLWDPTVEDAASGSIEHTLFRYAGRQALTGIVAEDVPFFLKNALHLKKVTVLEDNHRVDAGFFAATAERKPHREVTIKVYRVSTHEQRCTHRWSVGANQMTTEMAPMLTISHANILKFLGNFHIYLSGGSVGTVRPYRGDVITTWNRPYDPRHGHLLMGGLIMEKMTYTLQHFMELHLMATINEPLLEGIFRQIGSALDYLHATHNLIHADLSTSTIGLLVNTDSKGKHLSMPTFKLFDFENSKIAPVKDLAEAEASSACFSAAQEEVEPLHPKPAMKSVFNYTLNKYPINVWASNPYLNESFKFGQMLFAISEGRTNPAITNKKLLNVLKLMAPVSGNPQVTVGWALAEYSRLIAALTY